MLFRSQISDQADEKHRAEHADAQGQRNVSAQQGTKALFIDGRRGSHGHALAKCGKRGSLPEYQGLRLCLCVGLTQKRTHCMRVFRGSSVDFSTYLHNCKQNPTTKEERPFIDLTLRTTPQEHGRSFWKASFMAHQGKLNEHCHRYFPKHNRHRRPERA